MTKLQSVHSILIIYGVAFNLPNQKSWNDTENVLGRPVLKQYRKGRQWNYKNLNCPIHIRFLSCKIAQGILESIIESNREGKITIITKERKEKKERKFKEDEVRKTWKNRIKFLGVLTVKKTNRLKIPSF